MTNYRLAPAALALTGALALTALHPAVAAPVHGSTAALKAAVPNAATEVQWRRHHRGGRDAGAFVAGAATGLIVGGALAAAASQPRYGYYEPGYVYEPAPRYYAPAPTYYYDDSYAYEPRPVYRAPRGVGSSSVGCRGSSTGTVGLDPTAC